MQAIRACGDFVGHPLWVPGINLQGSGIETGTHKGCPYIRFGSSGMLVEYFSKQLPLREAISINCAKHRYIQLDFCIGELFRFDGPT